MSRENIRAGRKAFVVCCISAFFIVNTFQLIMCGCFWLRQELKESLYPSVCPSSTSFSRKPNPHLSLSGLVKLYLSAPSPYFVWQTEPTHTLSCFFTNWHMQKVECRCRSKYPQSECELVIVLCGVSADFCWHVLAALSSPGCRVCGHCISQSEGRLGSLDQSEDDSRLSPGPLGAATRVTWSSSHLTLPALHTTHCRVPVTHITPSLGRGNWPETQGRANSQHG